MKKLSKRDVDKMMKDAARFVRGKPKFSVGGLAKKWGVSSSTVYYHLKKMRDKVV